MRENFLNEFGGAKYVLESLPKIMFVFQSKREHRTMIQSNSTKLNVRRYCFFRIHTPVHGKVNQTTWNPLKKAFE